MIARKLASVERYLRGEAAAGKGLTQFETLHVAELLHAIAETAEMLEAHERDLLPAKVVAFRPRRLVTDDEPGSAA